MHDFGDDNIIISIPRWGDFSEVISKLVQRGIEFIEISGNDDILAISDSK